MNPISFIPKTRIQALSILLPYKFPDSKEFPPISRKSDQDISFKLKEDLEEEMFEEEEEHEFSFACNIPQGPLIFADEIFQNGQIQPVFHVSNQSIHFVDDNKNRVPLPLEKLSIDRHNCISSKLDCTFEDSYHEWFEKVTILEVDTSNESCKKSNFTEFSQFMRIQQDFKHRSNNNGQGAFVFLNPSVPTSIKPMMLDGVKVKNVTKTKTNDGKHKRTLSAHEKLYVKRRMRKENDKRRSFLPYKQNLVGFFANANRFSRNLHPF